MKKHYVYELYNLLGTVEYVGETINTKSRLYQHTKVKKGYGSGKFYNRTDISMNVVKEFDNKKDAYWYQCQLQKQYGLITDAEKNSHTAKTKRHSIETKLKISATMKSKPFRSRVPMTDETKQKLREAAIRRYSTTNV